MLLLSFPLLLFGLLCAWPLVSQRLLPDPERRSLALVTGFGLGIGGLTLWMLGLGLLPGRMLSLVTILIFPAVLWSVGLWASPFGLRAGARRPVEGGEVALRESWRLGLTGWQVWLWLATLGALGVSLIHSLYYPFVGEDEVSRYAYYARLIFNFSNIPEAINGYPLLLPLGYAYAFFLGGGIDEHLAKIVSWAFAPATVVATYWLASVWAGRRAGLAAAFTLAVTRLFVDWSPMGYVDIPTGLYFALAGVFVSLWLREGELRYALAAGTSAGLALWTKQAGFAVGLSLGLVFLMALVFGDRRRAILHGSAGLALAAVVGLPWYARNVVLGGLEAAVPGPGDFYFQQARRLALDWIPFITWAKDFGYGAVVLYLAGIAVSVAMLVKRLGPQAGGAELRLRRRMGVGVMWAFILPYLGLWWNWFSYDPRFLLTILPFYAALTGLGFEWVVSWLAERREAGSLRKTPLEGTAVSVLTAVLAGGLLLGGVYTRLGGGYRLLTAPFATDREKLLQYKPDVASTVAFLEATAVPGRDRIFSMDPRLAYYLIDYDVASGYPTELAQLDDYQYLVAGSWAFNDVYPRLGASENEVVAGLEDPEVLELLFTSELGTVKVYRVAWSESQPAR